MSGEWADETADLATTDRSGTLEPVDGEFTVACGTGAVRLLRVQRAGKGAVDAAEFLRGARIGAGARFED